ncbi:oligosaccharide flippase family protein [Jannaschia seohaensis]|uniref:Membrane protein involved in the export of O-antigen and teichoic acid n=1 Tax=Jannaschia seohaensis TaxID=475081 RepID=A0A2Y9BW45_9RHOB|nr:oligosaccharide flippase family protein [Jannaschia seohaensis]PWJ22174.1 O-antigen/teichoic acid export membrane protein [Jannaschia seohaensis]SSA38452.1 Membrane protein involved in the export of O-antigen and teichoic acid [Jannaschia seohaensis]
MTKETGSVPLLGAGALSAAERVVAQVCQFAIFVIAARALGPAEFGVFALVSACAILLMRAAEVGWAPYIMCWSGDASVPRQVLGLAVLSGVLAGALGFLGAFLGGVFGLEVATVTLAELFALWVVLATVSSAQKGMMVWMQRLRSSAVCEISGELMGLAVALGALWSGWGVLALVFGRLAYQTTHLTLSFTVTRLLPDFRVRLSQMGALVDFSRDFFFSRMLSNTRLYVATFIVGGALGPTEVGYLRVAERLVGAVGEVIAVPAQLLGWAAFKRARDVGDPEVARTRVGDGLAVFQRLAWAISVPLFVWLMVTSDILVAGLLSEEWLPAVPLIVLLALARLLGTFGLATEPLMSILGESRVLPRLSLLLLVTNTIAALAAVPFGLYAVAWAQLGVSVLLLVVTLRIFDRHAGVTPMRVLRDLAGLAPPLALGVAALLVVDWALRTQAGLPPLVQTVVSGLVAGGVYAGALALLAPRVLRELSGRGQPAAA